MSSPYPGYALPTNATSYSSSARGRARGGATAAKRPRKTPTGSAASSPQPESAPYWNPSQTASPVINNSLSLPRQQQMPYQKLDGGMNLINPSTMLNFPGMNLGPPIASSPQMSLMLSGGATASSLPVRPVGAEEAEEGDDDFLPAMADDDYSAQLNWQSHSKDNLKVLMENLSPAQYERFEAYRRHALPKQAVRKVIQQVVGTQVSQPVAQIVAGFAKVFVGEIVEKAREVQARRGHTGPLSPDHLREAYRAYQEETGRVGAAKPIRGKRLFVR